MTVDSKTFNPQGETKVNNGTFTTPQVRNSVVGQHTYCDCRTMPGNVITIRLKKIRFNTPYRAKAL